MNSKDLENLHETMLHGKDSKLIDTINQLIDAFYEPIVDDALLRQCDYVKVISNITERANKHLTKLQQEKDIVTITCYNKTTQMVRKDAIKQYTSYAQQNEGSEQMRYMTILMGLHEGKLVVSDHDE